MGGSSKKQVVGYRYYAGMHMILCHGPIDAIKTFEVDKKLTWLGSIQDGQVSIDQPGLFGGETREGGIVGNVDIESGKDNQTQNSYLQSKIITDIPAFRGVVGVILRGLYLGVNPYLKKWAFRAQRIFTRQNGIEQWYPEKAPIIVEVAETFVIDTAWDSKNGGRSLDGSVYPTASPYVINGTSLGFNTKDLLVFKMSPSPTYLAWSKWDADSNPQAEGHPWATILEVTEFDNGVEGATVTMMDEPYQVTAQEAYDLVKDRSYFLKGHDEYKIWVYDIPVDDNRGGVSLTVFKAGHVDMNPAHIIRECLTDPFWGMGYPEADMDDISFAAAADTLFDENFGISLLWDKQIPIKDFITEIIRHIDAALYVDRKTGLFVLKLIRDDYDEESLITLDTSNSKQIINFIRPTVVDLVNSITVNFWDYKTGETSSVSVEDPALIQMQGGVNNTTIQYPGISNQPLASSLALRDAMTLSSPLIRGTVECNQTAKDFDIGDVFKLTWPDYDIDEVIVRATAISFGDGKNNRIKVSFTQDKFSFSSVSIVAESEDEWIEPGGPPLPVDYQLTVESAYYTAIIALGQALVDAGLTEDSDAGYLTVAGVRPDNGINARLWVSPTGLGGTYIDSSPMEFCPSATLLTAVAYLDTTLTLENVEDLDVVVVGTYAQINNEVVSIAAVNTTLNTVTVGRGVLDTLPDNHAIGSRIFFYSLYIATDEVEYTATEEVGAKLATVSSEGELDVSDATEGSLTMDSRAIRPYPPAQIKIDASYYPAAILGLNDVTISWVGRDRTQQTAGLIDFTAGNIGPEAGVTYTLKCYNENDSLVKTYTGLTGTSQIWTTEIADSGLGRYNEQLRLVLYSVRSGYDSYQMYDYTFIREATPVNVTPPVITVL